MSLKIPNYQDPLIIPTVSPTQEGTVTPAMLAGFTATTAVALYVNSTTGSDSNPGTLAAPFATFDAAAKALPATWSQSATINCAAGNYLYDSDNYVFGAPVGPQATPLVIAGAVADVGLGTLTTLSGSTSSSYVASVVTVTGALRGASITNSRTGLQARISNNVYNGGTGDTTFTFMGTLSVVVGDTFLVTKPSTNFLVPAATLISGQLGGYAAYLNIRFAQQVESGSALPILVFANNAIGGFYNCELDGGTSGRFLEVTTGSRIVGSGQAPAWGSEVPNPVANTISGLWLYSEHSGGSSHQFFDGTQLIGYLMLDDGQLTLERVSTTDFIFLDMNTASFTVVDSSQLSATTIRVSGSNATVADSIVVSNNSNATLPAGTINGSAGAGIHVKNSRANIGAVTGTGNATFGIIAELGSSVLVNSVTTTVTGTTNDTEVGTTAKAYGALPFIDSNLNGIQL